MADENISPLKAKRENEMYAVLLGASFGLIIGANQTMNCWQTSTALGIWIGTGLGASFGYLYSIWNTISSTFIKKENTIKEDKFVITIIAALVGWIGGPIFALYAVLKKVFVTKNTA
ncbi:MAG: hypothetical protein FWC36_08710 [Spirochaetes bacterium]|nr:hypothetical protein [Spirochaetota bacterium]